MTAVDGAGSLPLMGRRMLITRAAGQASELAERLRGLGAETILIPTIEIVPPASFAALDEALRRIERYDVIAFTSANAVRAFRERADELGVSPIPRRIAVVGPATARAVEAIGLRVDTTPQVYTAEALAEALLAEALLPETRDRTMLLVLAEAAPQMLENALIAGGAQVAVAAAYANRIPQSSLAGMKELFEQDATMPDAVMFTSASTADHLVRLLDAAGLRLPESVARISIGPMTSKALARLRLPAHIEAAEPTIGALVAAAVAQLRANR